MYMKLFVFLFVTRINPFNYNRYLTYHYKTRNKNKIIKKKHYFRFRTERFLYKLWASNLVLCYLLPVSVYVTRFFMLTINLLGICKSYFVFWYTLQFNEYCTKPFSGRLISIFHFKYCIFQWILRNHAW